MSEPRDYLAEATGFIGAPAPLANLLETKRDEVVFNLVRSLKVNQGIMSTTVRKAAAYALGQIGDPSTLDELKARYEVESAPGVKDAIAASITAISLAPDGSSHSQLDRRRIIEEVYEGRRPAVLS